MNKHFFTTCVLFLSMILVCPVFLFSQLNGIYTVGGTSPNYSSIGAAVSALNSQGVSGAVIFNIRPGTYNEQITINSVSGVSSSKTVTFQSENGDSSAVIISYASSVTQTNNFTLRLNNSDYIYFKKVTVQRTGSNNYCQVVDVSEGATNNKFRNCRIIGYSGNSSTTYTVLVGSTNSADDSYNEFSYNLFQGGSYGLYYLGRGNTMLDQGLVVKNNIFENQYYKGMHLAYQNSPEVTGNIIKSASGSTSYNGIYAFYCDNALKIVKNAFDVSNGGICIYVHNSTGSGTQKGLIANNFISSGGNGESNGIYINLSSSQNIYYNSINIYSANASGKALNINGATTSLLDLKNNIFNASGGGYSVYVSNTTVTPFNACDYNDFYTTGSYLGFWQNDGNIADLATWKTTSGFDSHSVSADPLFANVTDLHAGSGIINNAGTTSLSAATPVSDDIDNQLRSTSKPDMGADEFFIEDLGVSAINIYDTICKNTYVNVVIYIKNYGAYEYNGTVPVYFQAGAAMPVSENTGNLSILPGDSIMYSFNTTYFSANPGLVPFYAGTAVSGDIDVTNDISGPVNMYVDDLPQADAGNDVSICPGDSVQLMAVGGIAYSWNTGDVAQQIWVKPADTTVYWVTVSDNFGCIASDSVIVSIYDVPAVDADFSISDNGLYVTFINTSTGADNYLWEFGDGATDTLVNPVHMYVDSGNYVATLHAYNSCFSDSSEVNFFVTSINENINSDYISVFPNPAKDYLFIETGNSLIKNAEINIKDFNAALIRKIKIEKSESHAVIDVSWLAPGVYYLELITPECVGIKKFIIID